MWINTIDPVLATIGPFQIRYYGITLALGILIILFGSQYLGEKRGIKKEIFSEFVIWISISALIGARVFEIIFYEPAYYLSDPIKILMIHHGGLSFHGALAGAIIALYAFSKRKKIPFLTLSDILVIPLALCLALGRLANFTNHELYGKLTDLPWAVKFRTADGFRHPTQIYESLKNLAIFLILIPIDLNHKKYKTGLATFAFIGLYGSMRFIIEFLKDKPLYSGLTMGQWLSIPMIMATLIFLVSYKSEKNQ